MSQNSTINWQTIIPNTFIADNAAAQPQQEKILTSKELLAIEKENILKALRLTKWKISGNNGAAALLQLPATTLASKIKALKIERPI